MGRRKIKIQPLNDDRNRTVTFVKRKAGLFKKAYELAVLCQVDLAVIIVGNNNKVYEFLLVDTKPLLDCYHARAPHEQKLPENYGPYKKKTLLALRAVAESDIPEDAHSATDNDDDYDSETPEPKRKKPEPVYAALHPPFRPQPEELPQRPVLRVQIPTDAKAAEDAEKTITAHTAKKDMLAPPELPNIYKLKSPDGYGKLKSPDGYGKLKSPDAHRIPALGSLSQPSPSEQYPPAILPTPVFNQFAAYGNAPSAHSLLPADDHPRSKPPFQQPFPPDQLMSALPSRYVNDIFPSPLTLYPQQEWPTGLTPYQPNMPHYFVPMPPGSAALPMPVNPVYLAQRLQIPPQRQPLYPQPPPDPRFRDYKKTG